MKNLIGLLSITLLVLTVSVLSVQEVKAQTATVPLAITVNGALVVTDAAMDNAAGKNPTLNVNLSVTPDLGAANVTGSANFRIRTNQTMWTLSAAKTALVANGTGIAETDILLDVVKTAGSNANASAGALQAPFTAQTNISSIMTTATTVLAGTAITSSARDSSNTNNYLNIATTYTIPQDFFFTPGTGNATSTITYTLSSP